MAIIWRAPQNVYDLFNSVRMQHHLPRLEQARLAITFVETKPFASHQFQWGKVSKFNHFNKLWQTPKFDFSIVLCSEVWHTLLDAPKREALADLHLTRCDVEYVPQTEIINQKKRVVRDDWGRVQFTDELKLDDEGNPKWRVKPLDLDTIARNVIRYGVWMQKFIADDTSWLEGE